MAAAQRLPTTEVKLVIKNLENMRGPNFHAVALNSACLPCKKNTELPAGSVVHVFRRIVGNSKYLVANKVFFLLSLFPFLRIMLLGWLLNLM